MEKQLDELSRTKENLYKEGSPVVLQSGAICREDEGLFALLSFRSISPSPISSVMVDLHVFDRANNEVEVVRDYLYLVDKASRGTDFGGDTPIEITNSSAVSLSVAVRRVAFGDDSVWDGSNSIWFEAIPGRKTLEEELEEPETVEQFCRDFSKDLCQKPETKAAFVPMEYKDLWFCACGEINHRDEENCYACNAMYLPQHTHLGNRVQIASNLIAHKKDLADKAEKARLEAERLAAAAAAAKAEAERLAAEERARQEAKAKRAKKMKTLALSISIPLAIAIAIYIYVLNVFLIPEQKYQDAKEMLSIGRYDEAITAFSAMHGYGDSVNMVVEAKYQKAEQHLKDGEFDEAVSGFEAIQEERDVEESIKRAKYQKALAIFEKKSYEEALALFTELAGYDEADLKAAECNFALAKALAEKKDLAGAKPYFDALSGEKSVEIQKIFLENGRSLYTAGKLDEAEKWFDNIKDEKLRTEIKAIYYKRATKLITDKKYEEARALLTELKDYKDSKDQLLRIEYLLAQDKFAAGKYKEAIALYEKAKGYKDAADRILECKYRLAKAEFDSGDYSKAAADFSALGSYSDSASMALEAQYLLGSAQLNAGSVMDAYNTLYAIKGYDKAYALLVSNSQFYIHVYDPGVGTNPLDER